jgi:peptidoglycan/xylan/chitin deacetylase (PgdA/CDA1 family)
MAAVGGLAVAAVLLVIVLQASSSTVSRPGLATHPGQGGTGPVEHGPTTRGTTTARRRAGNRQLTRLAALGLPVYCAGSGGDALAFTFDDGPGPYTHFALKKLAQAHERATFFAVGRSIDNFPGYLGRERKLATIGDHTYTHPLLTELPAATVQSEIERTALKIEAQSGQPVQLFRPPYGAHNPVVDQIAHRLGLLEILWNVDSADSLGANWAGIIRNVEAGMHPGSIILMHENRGQTIRALTTLLPELRRRHLRSVSVPELLIEDPPSAAQLKAGTAGCGGVLLHGSGG